jgi:uncharacterized membrane protein YidH (DUF202 family)
MSTLGWIKALFLAALLIGVAAFFGTLCRQMGVAYAELLAPSRTLVMLLLRLLLTLCLMGVAAGIVAALLRPWWLASSAIALSGLALLLVWGANTAHALLSLVYVLAAIAYAVITQYDLARRVDFSARAVAQNLFLLLVVLLIVALGSFYLGYANYIRTEGFSIPLKYRERAAVDVSNRIAAAFPEPFREGVRDAVKSQMEDLLSVQFRKTVKPVERWIPLLVAVVLFLPLLAITYALAFVPMLVLMAIFPLLRAMHIAKVTTQMIQVKRLVID